MVIGKENCVNVYMCIFRCMNFENLKFHGMKKIVERLNLS